MTSWTCAKLAWRLLWMLGKARLIMKKSSVPRNAAVRTTASVNQRRRLDEARGASTAGLALVRPGEGMERATRAVAFDIIQFASILFDHREHLSLAGVSSTTALL